MNDSVNHADETDVAIIGAGPVGLTLANELARRGTRVRIVEKQPAIREISKALIWHVRTQEALDRVGILARGLAEGRPLRDVVMRAYGKRIGAWRFAAIRSPHPHALIIGQNRTQHLLEDLLAERGVRVAYGTEAVALDLAADDYAAIAFADGSTLRAKYVVGCEGSNSLVRRTLGLTFEGERYAGEEFIQADCKIAWALPADSSYLFLTDDGYLMVIEMPDGFVRIFISLPDRAGAERNDGNALGAVEDMKAQPTLDDIRANLRRLTGIDATLREATWLARYRTSHRFANTFRKGRAFVAGDAGHVHVPIGGQGMNTGIQDAVNLGWKLAGVVAGRYDASILDTYDAERHPVAESLIHGTDRSYKGILHPSALQQRLVRMFGPFVMRTEAAQDLVTNVLEELSIAYPESPLTAEAGDTGKPKPGERARMDPRVVRRADYATLRLADVVREEEWTLLLFGGTASPRIAERAGALVTQHPIATDPNAADVPGLLLDCEGELHAAYDAENGTYVLLRPDGVVATRGHASDDDAVVAYLARFVTDRHSSPA